MMTFFSALITSLAFFTLATSSPTKYPPGKICKAVQRDANFDDLVGLPGNEINPIPTPYKGLFFQAYNFATVVQDGAPGLIPHSLNNFAATNAIQQATAGTPMMTVNFPSSNTTSFSLQDFYFGCALNAATAAAAVPTACIIDIAGYQGADNQVSGAKEVCAKQFQYNPSTMTGPQQLAYTGPISGCKDVQFIIFTATLPGGQAVLNVELGMIFDSVKYTTKSC